MGWDFKTCVHGITEGLDSHDCSACQELARRLGYDMTGGKTYIFTEATYKALKKKGKIKDENGL
jgi:hypothetical protein